MKTRLSHPLWTHLPAIAALVVLIVFVITASPLPVRVPIHFGFSSEPDSYGSPWSVFGLVIGLSVFFIILSVFLDELWARQEKTKTFNWLSLLDDVVVGAMVGISLGYLDFLHQNTAPFSFPWDFLGIVGGSSIVIAVILEMVRPYRYHPEKLVIQEDRALKAEIAQRLEDNSPFVYWDYQNPLYVSILTTILPLALLVAAVLTWFNEPPESILLIAVAVLLVIPYGGQRILVTRHDITVRFGVLGIRLLRLKTDDVTAVDIHEFSPLRDFGGYGIRFNREMKAYFLRGNHGVKLTVTDGKKYLIGSDFPERLTTVISAVSPHLPAS